MPVYFNFIAEVGVAQTVSRNQTSNVNTRTVANSNNYVKLSIAQRHVLVKQQTGQPYRG